MPDYIILSEGLQRDIGHTLDDLIVETDAHFAVFATRSGEVLEKRGEKWEDKVSSITALLTGIFNASRELASLVKENNFEQFLVQGNEWKLLYQNISPLFLLIVIFKERTLLGPLRISVRECAGCINELFKKRKKRRKKSMKGRGKSEENVMRDLFRR